MEKFLTWVKSLDDSLIAELLTTSFLAMLLTLALLFTIQSPPAWLLVIHFSVQFPFWILFWIHSYKMIHRIKEEDE